MKKVISKLDIRLIPASFLSILKFALPSADSFKNKKIKAMDMEFKVVKEYLLYHYLTYNSRENSITYWSCLHFELVCQCLNSERLFALIFLLYTC